MGDGFRLRLVEGEEDMAADGAIRPKPGRRQHETASLGRAGCAYRV